MPYYKSSQGNTPMSINRYDESIRLLSNVYSQDFAEFCAGDERMHELMMELATAFVEETTPVVREDAQIDLAAELLMSVTVTTV